MDRRKVTRPFPAFTLRLEKHVIPTGAILADFRVGRGHEGLRPHDENVASFRYDGKVYFNLREEIVGNTESL